MMPESANLTVIYGLYCPETGALRYIGQTKNPADRQRRHEKPSYSASRLRVGRWCLDLAAKGLKPRFEILTRVRDWETAEKRLIAAYRKAGADLLNVAAGGVDVPSGKPTLAGLNSRMWRAVIGELVWVIKLVEEPHKARYRCILNGARYARRQVLRKYGLDELKLYDVCLYAQVILRDLCLPLPFYPIPHELAPALSPRDA